MIEPPSEQLVKRLRDLGLCRERDFRRCRARVNRLAHDLPAFDTVWIDALVQARKLSPFQARVLESPNPDRLGIGPCVIVDQLGYGSASTTYLARRRDGNERCVVKIIDRPPECLTAGLTGLERLMAGLKGFAHPSVVAPHACLQFDEQLVVISRYVAGHDLKQCLIRRGRFRPAIVSELAGQLLGGLAALEDNGLVHGDLRLDKVRITAGGVAVLVDPGIWPAIAPELTIHDGRSPEQCDGIAPELIGTGNRPTSASDIYALGCLLWQLLAGRPPFPSGDPLAKLAAHQTREIGDVREWAPDVPAPLAEAIRVFTIRDPDQRPHSIREIKTKWGPTGGSGRKRLAKFYRALNTSAPRIPVAAGPPSENRWPLLVAVLFVLSGAVLTLFDRGATTEILSLFRSSAGPTAVQQAENDPTPGTRRSNDKSVDANGALLPMPGPNAQGIIVLESAGPYEAAQISAVGPLTIRGQADQQTLIVVRETPFRVLAEQLLLENICIRYDDRPIRNRPRRNNAPSALLLAQAQNLTIRNCSFQTQRFDSPAHPNRKSAAPPVAVAWKLLDPGDRSGGRVRVENTVFAGSGSALYLSSVPDKLQCSNCLGLGPDAFASVAVNKTSKRELNVELENLTLRQAGSLLRLEFPDRPGQWGGLKVEANNCVFDLHGPHAALFQLIERQPVSERLARIEMTGEGCLSRPDLVVAVSLKPGSSRARNIDADRIRLEGIFAGDFKFAGPMNADPRDSVIKRHQAPRRSPRPGTRNSSKPPGIDGTLLRLPR